MASVWTIADKAQDALNLPEGRLVANFGFRCEVSVDHDDLLEAAKYLIDQHWDGAAATQTKIMIQAQKLGCPALSEYAPLSSM